METWKEIKDYSDYKISNLGRVKSFKFGLENILKPAPDGVGYMMVNLSKRGVAKTFKIHRLVAVAFLGHNPDGTNKIVVDHKDEDRMNNNKNNLRLLTNRANLSRYKNKSSIY